MARLPADPEDREQMIHSWDGQCTYYRGRLDRDLVLDRYHDSNLPTTPDRPSWHVEHADDPREALMHTRNDIQLALDRNWATLTPEQRAQAIEYVYGPSTDIHRVDYTEVGAVMPENGPRDVLTVQHHPRGSYVEYVRSGTAPKDSRIDNRYSQGAFPGGKEQITLLGYDPNQVQQVTRQLNQYHNLAQNQAYTTGHPRDTPRQSAYPRTPKEALSEALRRQREAANNMRGELNSVNKILEWQKQRALYEQARQDVRHLRQLMRQTARQWSQRRP
jgi:hypothetical protein